jgi:hypothetical protein
MKVAVAVVDYLHWTTTVYLLAQLPDRISTRRRPRCAAFAH